MKANRNRIESFCESDKNLRSCKDQLSVPTQLTNAV